MSIDQQRSQAAAPVRDVGGALDRAKAAHRAGRLADAERLYRDVAAAAPAQAAEVHHWLGVLYAQTARLNEAIAQLTEAVRLDPGNAAAHCDLGSALGQQGHSDAAIAAFRQALRLTPGAAPAHLNLGVALAQQGAFDEAVACFERAIALAPDAAEPYRSLGVAQLRRGLATEAFAAIARHAAVKYGRGRRGRTGAPEPKSRHDREQLDYLIEAGLGGAAVRRLRDAVAARPATFDELYDAFFHVEGGARVAAAINLRSDAAAIEARWAESTPKIVVVDDLLTPEALAGLRRFCWGSTIWRRGYRGGYLGAMPEDGFACPLLGQIAEELALGYPRIFRHPLMHCWGFKYDSRLSGIGLHADFAAVNVNFWITPDEANLDPEGGGLVIWDTPAPLDWDYDQYNNYNNDGAALRDFLARRGARSVTIPYRANRAVIFDSDLFHETDRITFKEGYLNRRINITMLYGEREKR